MILDQPALERNIITMANWAKENGIVLRPHAKTHKSGEIARRQIAAGAIGICCAKIGEAEALAEEGIADILITSPVVSAVAIERLAALRRRLARLAIVVDHPSNVARLADMVGEEGLEVLVDLDVGSHRTGVTSAAAAVELAQRIVSSSRLRYRGVQFYCGGLQHVPTVEARRAALAERASYLKAILAALSSAGLTAEVVTGGGTGSFAIDAELGVLKELQPGSYIFMDRQYLDCERAGPQFETSLFIDSRVVSANTPGCVTVDAGLKAMATEAGTPRVVAGADEVSQYIFMGDEHGLLITPDGREDPSLDQQITLLTPHCDPTVNLYDRYTVCDGGEVLGYWPVSARGRSS